ncbi:MAG: sulfatase-like hydrolase/transferase [Planctomycetaceae bacterium]
MKQAVMIFAAWLLLAGLSAGADRPNILWLVSEDNGRFLGCYGDSIAKTPTIDALAKQGVVFERCFTQPVCAPSRFTLITGMHAASCGPAQHMRAKGKISKDLQGFPATLRALGYFTSNNAKTDYNANIVVRAAWTSSGKQAHYSQRERGEPFFSVFNHEITHESSLFPDKEKSSFDPQTMRVPPYQPDTPEIRADWARYYSRLQQMDQQIAAKLQELKDSGEAENTIVFYFSDNGGVLPRSKRFLQESGTHVPLIIYFPPKWQHLAPAPPGSRITDPVHFVDFASTVLSLVGEMGLPHFQGEAFAGSKRQAPREFVFCSRDRMDERYDMMRMVADNRWVYIRNFRPDLPYVQPLQYMFQARGYQSWAKQVASGKATAAELQFWGEKPAEELYDSQSDPDNVTNLATSPEHQATLHRMRAALRQQVVKIRDNGFLPEGSQAEGFIAAQQTELFPIERVFDLAVKASERDAKHLPEFITALSDQAEAIRWWGAQGCAMQRDKSDAARDALLLALKDSSGPVQIAAAEALARQGDLPSSLPVLERWVSQTENPWSALQAANVLDRLGESSRPALPIMKSVLEQKGDLPEGSEPYLQRLLQRTVAVLDGKTEPLVYPVNLHR